MTTKPTSHQQLEDLKAKKLTEPYKVKTYDLNMVKDVDLTKRTVTGISNAFYYYDSDGDVLVDGSTLKSITERGPKSNLPGKIKHALFHDLERLPSKVELMDERKFSFGNQKGTGQYFETRMLKNDEGDDTLLKYQEGVYDNHSIGFRYLDIKWLDDEAEDWGKMIDKLINPEAAEENGYMFLVAEIKQYEFSTVAFGANALTPYLGVKSENKPAMALKMIGKLERMEKMLRHGSKMTDDGFYSLELEILQVKQLISELFDSEPSVKDTLLAEGRRNKDTGSEYVAPRICTNCYKSFDAPIAGSAKCPGCGQYCDGNAAAVAFDLDKALKEVKFF